jgi:hypothetical protein
MFKCLTGAFKDRMVEFFGIKIGKIIGVEPTVQAAIEVERRDMDHLFLIEDGTLLHLEYQSTPAGVEDLERFILYDLRVSKAWRQEKNYMPKIRTVVIYPRGVKPGLTGIDIGTLQYAVENAVAGNKNAEEVLAGINEKIARNMGLDDLDKINLIFLPMMDSRQHTPEELAIESAAILRDKVAAPEDGYLIGCLMVMNSKLLDSKTMDRLWEVLIVTDVFHQYIAKELEKAEMKGIEKGIERGIEKGIEKGIALGEARGEIKGKIHGKQDAIRRFLARRFGEKSTGLQQKISQMTNLDVLDHVLEELFAANTLEEATAIVNDNLKDII